MKRMQRRRAQIGFVAGLCIGTANAVDPDEFAYGWPLAVSAESEFYDIPLRAEVYRHARSVDQMAILDADGEPMPFYLVSVEPGPASESLVTLDVSPVYRTQGGELISGLTVEASEEGVDVRFGSPPEDATQIVAFVADARELGTAPFAADLRWDDLEEPFLATVTISHSTDLARWSVVGEGSIASLAIDETRVRRSRISIDGRVGGFYRIGWSGDTPAPWVLDELDLIVSEEPDPTPVELVVLEPVPGPADAEEDAHFFDAGGLLPVLAVELELANRNTWANAVIASGDSLEGPWRVAASRRLFYRVDFQGDQVRAPVVQTANRGARFWRVLPDRSLDEDEIELRLHYPRERLRFAANGAAPYQLVGGGLSTEAGPDVVLSQVWEQLDEEMAVTVAELGAMRELGGEAAFIAPREFPWRSALLWGALSLGALVVGFMALRLGREAFA